MISEYKHEHYGVTFNYLQTHSKHDAHCTLTDEEKVLINGPVSFEIVDGSWKYGKEIRITVFGPPQMRCRVTNNKGYGRIDISLPFEIGREMIKRFNEKLNGAERP